jgi:hypothetical protein
MKERTTVKAERTVPRTSKASGGPVPDIDVAESAALQELDDLKYVKCLKNGFK